MTLSAKPVSLQDILPWRDMYRLEMSCQIIHDSIHSRPGWTEEYGLYIGTTPVGYGSIAVAGPWKGKPTLYEFYVVPPWRTRTFDLFEALLAASGAAAIETQSNDPFLSVLLLALTPAVTSESILFHDKVTTAHVALPGVIFRPAPPADAAQIAAQKLDESAAWLLELDGTIAATGGILFHYNRPYGDIYMAVAEPFRRRGLGSYLVQELKRISYEQGNVPAARCNPKNVASRKTLQKAGFVPCGCIVGGAVS
jgi:GNAT superfamily N-acetyltransferase